MEEIKIVNRVAESGLKTINLEQFFPESPREVFDLKSYLFQGLILKEKDFREALKQIDWTVFQGKTVLITCSSDAIIPLWAYMLVASNLAGYATDIYQGTEEEYLKMHYHNVLTDLNVEQYKDQRIVIKGCSDKPVPAEAYARITSLLKPFAQSIMFGEPCSTVPIFKRPRE